MGESLEFPDILQEVRGAMNPGRLKLQPNNLVFKNIKTGKLEQYQAADIDTMNWLMRARGHCLKVTTKGGTVHRFDGFKEMEFDKLSGFIQKHYDTNLTKKDVSLKGWNWGNAKFKGNSLDFEVGGHTAFEIPLVNVSHTATSKNEVTLEFHQNDDAFVSLMELRFHIPVDPNTETDTVQEFYQNVLDKADIIQATGDAIAVFSEVQCLTPRGRYDIKIYPSFLQLHGKTFDYKIPYATILRLFLLPHKDGRQMFFVVSLDPPIKQGQTRYHFMILLFNKEDELSLELGLSEDDIQEKYEGKLTKEMAGPEYEIISRIMKTLVNRKITVPGSFIGHTGTHSIACSYKAATGFLYPLERGFIFVIKPPIHIRFDEVSSVNFARSASATRSFDFDVHAKSGSEFTFVGIEKDEYGKLYDFVTQKKLQVKNIGGPLDKKPTAYHEDMTDSEDDDQHDAYLQRVKREGKEREVEEEDDDSSEDEDFDPDEAISDTPDDEYNSNPESTDSEDEDYVGGSDAGSGSGQESKPKKEKPMKEKKERKPRSSEGKSRKKKVKKDPTQPKRPQSAYFLWLNETREQIKEENPGISITDVSKKAGEMWKEVTDKTRWEKLAVEAKEHYEVVMAEWRAKPRDERSPSPTAKSPKKRPKKKDSPVKDSKGGAGESYKSKEFISDSDSGAKASESDDDEKPLKKKKDNTSSDSESEDEKPLKKVKEEKPKKKKKRDQRSASSSEEEKPARKRSKRAQGEKIEKTESEEDAELPDDEEVLTTPPGSGSDGNDSASD